MKKRICIFSFYEKSGYVDDYVRVLLKELSLVTTRLIIVVNGSVSDCGRKIFLEFSNEIYIRDNTGYDAGAYKYILMNVLKAAEMKLYEEVIFCNDTFFGPLCSGKEIFKKMEHVPCDFWGLNGFFHVVFAHIQSYFLVFRKKIIQEQLLYDYFKRYIDETTAEMNDVYCQFETGLFDFLGRQRGMKYAMYARECNCDVYRYSYAYLKEHRLPIVKKKTFSKPEEDFDNIWCTLSFVKYETAYDVNLILNSIRRVYRLDIKYDEIQTIDRYRLPDAVEVPSQQNDEEQIEQFLSEGDFYIYGAGMYASKAYWRFARDSQRFLGFIVSDGRREGGRELLFGYPVFEWKEVKNIPGKRILLGIGKDYSLEIVKTIKDTSNLLRIF